MTTHELGELESERLRRLVAEHRAAVAQAEIANRDAAAAQAAVEAAVGAACAQRKIEGPVELDLAAGIIKEQ